ncbi:hypothetical protein OBBRIDRAFT_107792 [Obba rivulosa]|uniref:Uncharacterized protein n=1 Tax=Obba rivulosa TaxID=1052685 RepID=A0A8E2DIN1_9APHY|nr:hypothetical protein OBBRIDRAFT_107792 [Obba rivulosa]
MYSATPIRLDPETLRALLWFSQCHENHIEMASAYCELLYPQLYTKGMSPKFIEELINMGLKFLDDNAQANDLLDLAIIADATSTTSTSNNIYGSRITEVASVSRATYTSSDCLGS